MPKQRMALRMIKDVIRLKWDAQLSHEQIAAALGVSKGVIGKYVGLAAAAGLDWERVRDWDERLACARAPRADEGRHARVAAAVARRLDLGGQRQRRAALLPRSVRVGSQCLSSAA